MSYENLLVDKGEQLAVVTIHRPKVLNALNAKTIEELDACFRSLQHDSEVRAVILTGAGEKAFVAGADINELATYSPQQAQECSLRGQAVLHRIEGDASNARYWYRRSRREAGPAQSPQEELVIIRGALVTRDGSRQRSGTRTTGTRARR